jgi:hypothetical protein
LELSFSENTILETWVEILRIYKIYAPPAAQPGKLILNLLQRDKTRTMSRMIFNQEIEIALGAGFATRRRAEKS